MIEKICEELDLDEKDLLIKNLQKRIDKALQELDKYRIDLDLPSFTDKMIINTRKILRGSNNE